MKIIHQKILKQIYYKNLTQIKPQIMNVLRELEEKGYIRIKGERIRKTIAGKIALEKWDPRKTLIKITRENGIKIGNKIYITIDLKKNGIKAYTVKQIIPRKRMAKIEEKLAKIEKILKTNPTPRKLSYIALILTQLAKQDKKLYNKARKQVSNPNLKQIIEIYKEIKQKFNKTN